MNWLDLKSSSPETIIAWAEEQPGVLKWQIAHKTFVGTVKATFGLIPRW